MAAYVKAVVLAFAAAIAVGAGIGAVVGAGKLSPADKATVYAAALSEAMNCAAFFVIVFVPLAVVFVFIRRFRRGRAGAAR
jgi:Na+-driven multidrug efflux pump